MTEPNCPICHQELPPAQPNDFNALVHTCPCGVKVSSKEGEVVGWAFEAQFKNTTFKLFFFLKNHKEEQEFILWDKDKWSLTLKSLPNITPANAQDKIRFLLVFS